MKITNFKNATGKAIPNQYMIEDKGKLTFQSYDKIIAIKNLNGVQIDINYWKYSATTSKYRSIFLEETTKETQKKIDSKEYRLTDLNK